MFLLIWGWRAKWLPLGLSQTLDCVTCERPRPFQLVLQYRIFHLYWIIRAVTSRRYVRMCTVCSRGPEVDRAYAESGLGGDPVPVGDRYGLLAAGVLVGFVALAAALGLI
jgi:hypothetical protein